MNITYPHNRTYEKIMLTTDLDGTFLNPSNEHKKINVEDRLYCTESIKRAEAAVIKNNIDSVHLNTGRNFTELCEVQDILKNTGMPVTSISLEDGKRLLTKPEYFSTEQWLKLLFNKKVNYLTFQDTNWAKINNAPLKAIGDFLTQEKGFIHRKDDGEKLIYSKPIETTDAGVTKTSENALWIVTLVPPGITFDTTVRDTDKGDIINIKDFNTALTKEIEQMLVEKGFNIGHPKTKQQIVYKNTIERKDINKGAVADYVNEHANSNFEIRAGNAENDISLLSKVSNNTQMIQVGEDQILSKKLYNHPNLTKVQTGNLADGIDEACKKLNFTV